MLIQPVILTTAREGARVDHIRASFAGREGFAEPLVVCDHHREGAARATRAAIIEAGRGGDHVLFLEDDVLVHEEAPARIAKTSFPDEVAAISFCDMREVPEHSPAGLYPLSPLGSDGRGWWGNQALLLHRDTVAMCSAVDWFAPDVQQSPGLMVHKAAYHDEGRNCSDIRLALLVHMHGGSRRTYAVHVPSLVRHMGHESACFPGRTMGERETRNWIGDRQRFGIDSTLRAEGVA